ncbi:MAG: hypothetical protein KAW41_07065 [Candidatus Diapherotrites archaeon]|nr:hypothetical protein [Candidatus Diapherotrites archaeon]
MSHFRETCPDCYMNKGYSIALTEEGGAWKCGQCGSRFVVGEDGYFKQVRD